MANLSQLVIDLEAQRKQVKSDLDRLDVAIATLRKLNGRASVSNIGTARRGRRRLSAAARKRIADAQRARWAKWKQQQKRAA
jgi:hypothetical protein